MRFLPHHADSTCANGGCLGSVPQLWTDRHLPCRPYTSVASRILRCASACFPASLDASAVASPDDGRIRGRKPPVLLSKHRFAPETRSRTASAHGQPFWSRGADTLDTSAFTDGTGHAELSPSRNAGGECGRRSAKPLASHPGFPRPAQHDAWKRHFGHAWNDRRFSCSVPSWQRCAVRPSFAADPGPSSGKHPGAQSRQRCGN